MKAPTKATQIPNHLIEIKQIADASIKTVIHIKSDLGCFLLSQRSKNKRAKVILGRIKGIAICNMNF